jgi:non-specific serine/threonine protein kinase/serine/threonine-protein kinase
MTPEEWQRVRSVLESALELEPSMRSRFLDDNCGDISVRREVDSLIHLHEQSGTDILNSPTDLSFLLEDEVQFRLVKGKRIGAYEILDEIAQGGMGAVYRSVRADGQYTQHVALKIVRADAGAEITAARFRNERQILASLDHPNIAKILDGGTTADGLPYFVMELIEGLPITEYCDRYKLSIDARLTLFRTICSAVQYAHQRLVIHRDIKPTNVLITFDGVPKLLDFGIAKLLDQNVAAQRQTITAGAWMMTPEYASPEQLRGDVVTTATDVYSLGLVLYELLTGYRAYGSVGSMPHEISNVVCNVEPQKPSLRVHDNNRQGDSAATLLTREEICALRQSAPAKLQKRLSGDLDNIVLMALRKEASRRYASVEQFAEDLRRHMEHVPVAARTDTPWYRASKFVSRHRTGVPVSIVMVLAILAGVAAISYEAHVAKQQAEIAREQRLRAERRFNDVRKLANSLMFEVHDSIKDLPGSTPARKLLVDRALEYLDSLAQESKGDLALQRELAAAYDRVGDLLGYSGAANLGDFEGALQSYNKALAIRESSAASAPDDTQIQSDLLNEYFHLSFVQQDAEDYPGALANLKKALPVAQKFAASQRDPKYRDWLAGVYWKTAGVLSADGDHTHALENYRLAIAIREPIASDSNSNPLFRTHLAGDYVGMGMALGRTGDVSLALQSLARGTQVLEQLSQSNPNNATLSEYLGEAYASFLPVLVHHDNDIDEALQHAQKAQKIFDSLWSRDRTNALARANLGLMDLAIGELLIRKGRVHEAIPNIQKAISIFEAVEHKNHYELNGEAEGYSSLARAYVSLADHDKSVAAKIVSLHEARSWYRRSLQTWKIRHHATPQNSAGDPGQATSQELAKCDAALAKLNPPMRAAPSSSAAPR